MPCDLFTKWLNKAVKPHTGVSLYTERTGARSLGLAELKKLVADHFVGEGTIAQAGGYTKSAAIIANSLPTNKRTRSGDLGELLATEYLNSETTFVVPIRKLRWKSDRETASFRQGVEGWASRFCAASIPRQPLQLFTWLAGQRAFPDAG